ERPVQLTGTNQPTTSTPNTRVTRPLCGSRTTNTTPHPGCPSVLTVQQSYGGHSEGETPGPIPNPEAKPFSADGTALETGWESRTPPDNPSPKAHPTGVGLRHFHDQPPRSPSAAVRSSYHASSQAPR